MIYFDQALQIAQNLAHVALQWVEMDITLVRDLKGRIRLLLDTEPQPKQMQHLTTLMQNMHDQLGAYGYPVAQGVFYASQLSGVDLSEKYRINGVDSVDGHNVYLLDRQIHGQDWTRQPISAPNAHSAQRFTFYGIKGGVGRSTTLAHWAWHLANQGKKVLIFDLDLESPGVSSTMLPTDFLPDYGVVDWLIEDGVGQADDMLLRNMYSTSPLGQSSGRGEVWVVPAYGQKNDDYLAKLSRCYADKVSVDGVKKWADRLNKMVSDLEQLLTPNVVILDSRAGLHDISAALITRLNADTLLFGTGASQTWQGYKLLFQHWQRYAPIQNIRERLHTVASMIPETGRKAYLERFTESAWNTFATIYDADEEGALEIFAPNLNDDNAPHTPIPIYWHRALQEFDPTAQTGQDADSRVAQEAFGDFFARFDALLTPRTEPQA